MDATWNAELCSTILAHMNSQGELTPVILQQPVSGVFYRLDGYWMMVSTISPI